MARFGTWAPLAANWAAQPRLTTPDIICLHTMVGSLAGTDGMFRHNGYGGTFSHFGIGGEGSCTQWQDTDYRAAANYNGNHRIISVECADMGAPFTPWNTSDGSAVPAFSDAQIETLAQLVAAMCKAHNIPCQLIPDALPGRRGVGYHRLGVPGYMVAGAEQWSTATGKVCPGNRRIAQIPQVIARAQQILNGADMPLTEPEKTELVNRTVDGVINRIIQGDAKNGQQLWQVVNRIDVTAAQARDAATGANTRAGDALTAINTQVVPKIGQGSPVTVDAAAVAAALGADTAAMDRLAAAIAAQIATRLGNG